MIKIWRRHTTVILILGLVSILVALVVAFMVTNFSPRTDVRIGATGVFQARVADDEKERQKGLSGVERLKDNEALLMVFDGDAQWGIWMKDMRIPLDIVWLDKDFRVVHIVKNASPDTGTSETFRPTEPARYVLEFNAGASLEHNIQIGDLAVIALPEGSGE